MIMTELELLYDAAVHSQKCIQIAAGNTPQSYRFMLKWPDLCHSLIQYYEIKDPGCLNRLARDFDEVINRPMKIIIESYIQTLKQLEMGISEFADELGNISSSTDIDYESILERKDLMVKLVNKVAAKIRDCGVQVEGVYDER